MLLDMIFPNGRFKSLEVDRRVTLPSHMLAAHLYCIFAPCHFRGRVGVVSKYLRMSHFCTFIPFRTILVHICRDSNLDPNPNSSVYISQTILSALGHTIWQISWRGLLSDDHIIRWSDHESMIHIPYLTGGAIRWSLVLISGNLRPRPWAWYPSCPFSTLEPRKPGRCTFVSDVLS